MYEDPLIQEEWTVLSRKLGLGEETVEKLRSQLLTEQTGFPSLISNILENWIALLVQKPKLSELVEILEKDCGAVAVGGNEFKLANLKV